MSITVAPSFCLSRCRLSCRVLIASIKSLYAIFLKALGCLLSYFGARSQGARCCFRALQIENQCEGLYRGLFLYGCRFLISTDTHAKAFSPDLQKYQAKGHCRGMCDSVIEGALQIPPVPLTHSIQPLEEGVPSDIVQSHNLGTLPQGVAERRLSSQNLGQDWSVIPRIEGFPWGKYTFVLGFSKDQNTPLSAHRIAFFKGPEGTFLFDPSDGLVEWRETDWEPLLKRTAVAIREGGEEGAFFTAEWYQYERVAP